MKLVQFILDLSWAILEPGPQHTSQDQTAAAHGNSDHISYPGNIQAWVEWLRLCADLWGLLLVHFFILSSDGTTLIDSIFSTTKLIICLG